MGKKLDLVGQVFARLTVIKKGSGYVSPTSTKTTWICECSCGNTKEIVGASLRNGTTTSCGCYNKEIGRLRKSNLKHGACRTPEYQAWVNAKKRCYDKKDKTYDYYGGRGITMCPEWINDFQAFYNYIGKRKPGESLDRINPNGNYEPGNVRWATPSVQSINQRKYSNNKSGHKGIYWNKQTSKWIAEITVNNKKAYLGSFFDIKDAINVRMKAEEKYHNIDKLLTNL